MPTPPPHFTSKALTFLRQLEKNNTREWFQPRKEEFEQLVRQPMLGLAERVNDALRLFAVDHVTEPRKAVHRIYRNLRFSKDKTPYKTYTSAMFPPKGLGKTGAAIFYFSVSPKQVVIAAGSFRPQPAELKALRQHIADHSKSFRAVLENRNLLRAVGPLCGESAARPPRGYTADHPAVDLIRRTQFYYRLTIPPEAGATTGLEKSIVTFFRAAGPAVAHLNSIIRQSADDTDDEVDVRPQRPEPMF